MSKFKIGDKVRVIGKGGYSHLKENQVGIVTEKIALEIYSVTFSENPFAFETSVRTRIFFSTAN